MSGWLERAAPSGPPTTRPPSHGSGGHGIQRHRGAGEAGGALPFFYEGEVDRPVLDVLRQEVRQSAEYQVQHITGRWIDSTYGSYVMQQKVFRAGATGEAYRQILAWAVGQMGVMLISARQPGWLSGAAFTPIAGSMWETTVVAHGPSQARIRCEQMPAVPPAQQQHGGGQRAPWQVPAADPYGPGYGGSDPELWTNLPYRARELVEQAVHIGAPGTVEHSLAVMSWESGVGFETFFLDRRNQSTVCGVYAIRSVPCARFDPAWQQHALAGRPWTVTVFAAATTSGGPLGLASASPQPHTPLAGPHGHRPLPPHR